MTPPDARVLIVATLIIAGVPVAVHEYRLHAHHWVDARAPGDDGRLGWSAASSSDKETRAERGSAREERPQR
ncbi:MAG: hypothetical protein KGI67_15295 [Pseudomonadota bacterium]|nr:hypothetical protein [Pseudomonadota bacterium]